LPTISDSVTVPVDSSIEVIFEEKAGLVPMDIVRDDPRHENINHNATTHVREARQRRRQNNSGYKADGGEGNSPSHQPRSRWDERQGGNLADHGYQAR